MLLNTLQGKENIAFQAAVFIYLVWIFTGDTCCDYVAPGRRCSRQPLEVNGGVSPWLDPVQHPDIFDSLERNPHGNLTEREREKHSSSTQQAACDYVPTVRIYLISNNKCYFFSIFKSFFLRGFITRSSTCSRTATSTERQWCPCCSEEITFLLTVAEEVRLEE